MIRDEKTFKELIASLMYVHVQLELQGNAGVNILISRLILISLLILIS